MDLSLESIRDNVKQAYLFDITSDITDTGYHEVTDEEVYSIAESGGPPAKLLKEINWDFTDSITQYLTHKFHSYPARFIPQIPCTAIRMCMEKDDDREIVFDIFSGCGTTGVEALLAHKNAICVDANPLAALITRVKCTRLVPDLLSKAHKLINDKVNKSIDNNKLRDYSSETDHELLTQLLPKHILNPTDAEYKEHYKHYVSYLLNSKHDAQIHINNFYMLSVIRNNIASCAENNALRNLHVSQDTLKSLEELFLVALSSVANRLKNSRSKDHRNNILPLKLFNQIVESMIREMEGYHERTSSINFIEVYERDSQDLSEVIPDNHVDHIITSPPYPNALDYHREHKENLLWLGLPFRNFQSKEIGSHSRFAGNRFRMLSQYLSEMFYCMSEMCRVLKPGKYACVLIGNSSVEHVVMENHRFLTVISGLVGMPLQTQVVRSINKRKKYTSQNIGNIDDEYVMLFRKEHYVVPKHEIVIELVLEILSHLQGKLSKKTLAFDERTLQSSAKRFLKQKNSDINEAKRIYQEKNMGKLDEAIRHARSDCERPR